MGVLCGRRWRKGAVLNTVDDEGRTPLRLAAESGHEAVVRLLVEKGADLKSQDNKPLAVAAWNENKAVIQLLLTKESDLKSSSGWSALLCAARDGCEAVVRLLFEKGVNLEPKDKFYGRTPLL
jgi:ankyrin repeat protein